jgi:hypothetical protein
MDTRQPDDALGLHFGPSDCIHKESYGIVLQINRRTMIIQVK